MTYYIKPPMNVQTPTLHVYKTHVVQKVPYRDALPFTHRRVTAWQSAGQPDAQNSVAGLGVIGDVGGTYLACQQAFITARFFARERIVKRARNGQTANVALTLLDIDRSAKMILARTRQLLQVVSALKRGRFGDAVKALYRRPPRWLRDKKRSKPSDWANHWLELTFGWKPLVQDIDSAVKVLTSDFPVETVSGTSSETWNFSSRTAPDPSGYWSTHTATGRVSVKIAGKVKVTNPNLLLANQLGLTNPLYVLWDAIPFSFVVDWGIPIGKYLSSFNDMAGIDIISPEMTYKQTCMDDMVTYNPWFPGNWIYGGSTGSNFERIPLGSIPDAEFPGVRLPTANLWLAATSMALLTQQFTKR